MKIKAVLLNAKHREYGVASVPFPIEQDAYDETIQISRLVQSMYIVI